MTISHYFHLVHYNFQMESLACKQYKLNDPFETFRSYGSTYTQFLLINFKENNNNMNLIIIIFP